MLCLAGFGYDWTMNKSGKAVSAKSVSYQQALTLARTYESEIDFNNDSYNLNF